MTVLTCALRSSNVDPAFLECMSKIRLEPLEVLHALWRSAGTVRLTQSITGTSSWKWSSFWTCSASSTSEGSSKPPTRHGQITRTRYNVNCCSARPYRFQSLLGTALFVGEFFRIPMPKDRILGSNINPSLQDLLIRIHFYNIDP